MKMKQVNPRRLTLRGWAAIDDLSRDIKYLSENGEWRLVAEKILEIIELSTEINRDDPWFDTSKIYSDVLAKNIPSKDFPILTSKEKGKPLPWEYSGRSWYFWLNVFAESYGWSEEEIAKLDIDTAIGLYQEIVINKQLNSEWDWGLSEMSYEYNKSTKQSNFKPLPRPDWMLPIAGKKQEVKTSKFPASMVPKGNVVNLDEIQPTKEAPK